MPREEENQMKGAEAVGTENRDEEEGGGMLSQLKEQAESVYAESVEKTKEIEEKLESYVRDRPFQSLFIVAGVSLGVGLLVGVLVRR